MREAVIVAAVRSPGGRYRRGGLAATRADEFGLQVVKGLLAKVPQLDPKDVDDLIVGCAFPEAETGMNLGRVLTLGAGLPIETSGMTVNRFCSSGLQAIADATAKIQAGLFICVYALSFAPALLNLPLTLSDGTAWGRDTQLANAGVLFYLILLTQLADMFQTAWSRLVGRRGAAGLDGRRVAGRWGAGRRPARLAARAPTRGAGTQAGAAGTGALPAPGRCRGWARGGRHRHPQPGRRPRPRRRLRTRPGAAAAALPLRTGAAPRPAPPAAGHALAVKKNVLRDSAAMIQNFYQVFEGPQVPKGEVYRAIEVPKGEMGVYIRSEGGAKPARVRFTTPSYYHAQAVPALVEGEMVSDMVAIFASVDVVLGDCDR